MPGRWITGTYHSPQLTPDQGRSLPFIGTLFPQFYNTDVLLWASLITAAQMVFRTDALGAAPVQRLHLELSLAQLIPRRQPRRPVVATPDDTDRGVVYLRSARAGKSPGADRHHRTNGAGRKRALRLDQVIVTATETRLFLQPTEPLPATSWGNGNLPAAATLHVGDGSSTRRDGGRMRWEGTHWIYPYIERQPARSAGGAGR